MSGAFQIVVVGCGAIGLPVAVAFASRGCKVTGVDTDPARLAALRAHVVPDIDEGLGAALTAAAGAGRIAFHDAIVPSDARRAFIVAVPTPIDAQGKPMLSGLDAAIEAIAASAHSQDLLVIRATVPIGTTRRLTHALAARGRTLKVAACPDRTVAGRSFAEQFAIPHIIGGVGMEAGQAAQRLFEILGPAIPVSTPETAEAIKLFANVQRDVSFAMANEFALVCEQLDLDFGEVVRAGSDAYPRFALARPGPVAGPCLTKDTALLADSLDKAGTLELAIAARRLNASLLEHVAGAVARHVRDAAKPTVAVLGLAFKGNPPTTDRRASFGVALAARLRGDVAHVTLRLCEPTSTVAAERDLDGAIQGVDVVVICNDHPEFRALDIRTVATRMRADGLIYDTGRAVAPVCGPLPNGVIFHRFGERRGQIDSHHDRRAAISSKRVR